jgi:hypothetical protein
MLMEPYVILCSWPRRPALVYILYQGIHMHANGDFLFLTNLLVSTHYKLEAHQCPECMFLLPNLLWFNILWLNFVISPSLSKISKHSSSHNRLGTSH